MSTVRVIHKGMAYDFTSIKSRLDAKAKEIELESLKLLTIYLTTMSET